MIFLFNFAAQSTFQNEERRGLFKGFDGDPLFDGALFAFHVAVGVGRSACRYLRFGGCIYCPLFGFRPAELAGQAGFIGVEAGFSSMQSIELVFPVVWIAVAVLLLSLGSAFYLTRRRAVKTKEPVGRAASARFIANLSMPLVAGGLLMLVLLFAGQVWLMIPLSLIFYGIAMFNAGNYTFRELKMLGAIEVVLGLFAALFPVAGLLFWAAGFGLMHIIYGIVIHYKYQR